MMNYQKIYDMLIEKAMNRVLRKDAYVERHHIIPRSMGGSDELGNIVPLTAKEHYVAHHLLWKIHQNISMAHAFCMMSTTRSVHTEFHIKAIMYQSAKEYISSQRRGKSYVDQYGLMKSESIKDKLRIASALHAPISPESIKKRSDKMRGRTHSDKTKDKISKANTGKLRSDETKALLSEIRTGKPNTVEQNSKISQALMGITRSDETRQKMSEAKKGMTFTDEHIEKLRVAALLRPKQTEETKQKRAEALREYQRRKRNLNDSRKDSSFGDLFDFQP
jgi:hypothetical protein